MSYSLKLVYQYLSVEPLLVWEKLKEMVRNIVLPEEEKAFLRVESNIIESKKPYFNFKFQNIAVQYSSVGNADLSFLLLDSCIENIPEAYEWVHPLLLFTTFIQAWVYDKEYDYWQNIDDLQEFKRTGREHSHLPLISNNLPYPLERTVIDTSHNPGRFIFRYGYIEAIGSVMWLSDNFFNMTKAKKNKIKEVDWIDEKKVSPSIMQIQVLDKCFTTDEGIERDIQEKLRDILYPKSV